MGVAPARDSAAQPGDGIDLMHELFGLAERKRYRVYVWAPGRRFSTAPSTACGSCTPARRSPVTATAISPSGGGAEVAAEICQARADMLFVAMSSPSKEYFLARWGAELDVPFSMGVGGAIDVLAGVTRRAPGFSNGWASSGHSGSPRSRDACSAAIS